MAKQKDKHPFEDNPFLDGLLERMSSAEGQLHGEVRDEVWTLLEKADVDAKKRKIIWPDGARLSITECAQLIHTNCPDFPLELIETNVIGWLEMDFSPPNYSEKQLDELDRLTEEWIDAHERQRKA